jgi:glyoxylase-like metal-dependent hydrolase (beta-lactamase superfamily II)
MRRWSLPVLSSLVVILCICGVVQAQDDAKITIHSQRLADNLYMLSGAGCNHALLIGEDGPLLTDTDMAGFCKKVLAAVKEIADKPVRLVVNTHCHFDHVGGNENLAKNGAMVIAHQNVRKRMSSEQVLGQLGTRVPPSPPEALPRITFAKELDLHWNGEDVRIIHIPPGHTDGDCLVFFQQADVLHTGDIYFNGVYPFIDVNADGSIDGMIQAVDLALALANEDTRIIPGHGKLSNAAELREYREMLADVRGRIKKLIKKGKSLEEVLAEKPTKDLDEKWARGGMKPDVFVGVVYDGLTRAKPASQPAAKDR